MTVLLQHVVVLAHLTLLLVVELDVEDLLLNLLFVSLLQARDVIGSLLGLLDLFPGFHFFLFEEGNTVCQKLSVPLDAKM